MLHYRGKKALYEVMGKAQADYPKTPAPMSGGEPAPKKGIGWPKKPKMVQINADRVEISLPYQLAIAILLGVILLFLVVFRLGQISSLKSQNITNPAVETPKTISKTVSKPAAPPIVGPLRETSVTERRPEPKKIESSRPRGNNRIVIQTYESREQLEPVKLYFAEKGVQTEIRKIGDRYYLVTGQKYDNPEREGTEGYQAKQKIIEIGAGYKAPPGYENFGIKPFSDAYGMRFDD